MTERVTLITGASAGIGTELARVFASNGHRVALAARREQRLAELGPRGVRVTALCPGPVPSEFQSRAGFLPGVDSVILNVTPADVAKQGYRGLMAGKRTVIPGLGVKIVPFLLRLLPRGFILGAVGLFQLRKR